MAVWLAPPPIQLPARVASPLHAASKSKPPTVSGEKRAVMRIAIGPPIIMPTVAVKNMINALGPSRTIPFKSVLRVIKINEAGKK